MITGQLREILRMHVLRGLLLYFLIASPWYYAMYTVHGMDFINTFLGFHNVTRFTMPEHAKSKFKRSTGRPATLADFSSKVKYCRGR